MTQFKGTASAVFKSPRVRKEALTFARIVIAVIAAHFGLKA